MLSRLCLVFCFLVVSQWCIGQSLVVSGNGRYLQYADDKPFLWLGDTAWEWLHKLEVEEAAYYLDTRKEQGFNVIQTVVLAEDNGLRKPNANGDVPFWDTTSLIPNERYFQMVDTMIAMAAQRGFYIALLPTWGDKVPSSRPGHGPVIFDVKKAEHFGRFLAERYRNQPIIWVLGGDRNAEQKEEREIWSAMARGISQALPVPPVITYHPAGEASSSAFFHQETWLSFNMYQTGHAHRDMDVARFAHNDYRLTPNKPFLDGEPGYEDIPIRFWEYLYTGAEGRPMLHEDGTIADTGFFRSGYITDREVRRSAYISMLSGACGYTYGHNAVWQFFESGTTSIIPCFTGWKTALRRPGAEQMRHVKTVFTIWPFEQLLPSCTWFSSLDTLRKSEVAGAVANDSSFALVYLANGGGLSIDKRVFPEGTELVNYWFNPRDGTLAHVLKTNADGNILDVETPTDEDWVLIMHTEQYDRSIIDDKRIKFNLALKQENEIIQIKQTL